ncbi:hypothetical protein BGX29_010651 [Mortierella sp. GBA35]|nr:hypothetical protein BGX29_010651 [Mortierella sp. GBA35]
MTGQISLQSEDVRDQTGLDRPHPDQVQGSVFDKGGPPAIDAAIGASGAADLGMVPARIDLEPEGSATGQQPAASERDGDVDKEGEEDEVEEGHLEGGLVKGASEEEEGDSRATKNNKGRVFTEVSRPDLFGSTTKKSKHGHHGRHAHGHRKGSHPKKHRHHHHHPHHRGHGKQQGPQHQHQHHDANHDPLHRHHGHKHQHHHHHTKKKTSHVKRPAKRVVNLVCDGLVIDKIRCIAPRPKPPPSCRSKPKSPLGSDGDDAESGVRLYALTHKHHAKKGYIFMSPPCSKRRPPTCRKYRVEASGASAATAENDLRDNVDNGYDDASEDGLVEANNNGGKHKGTHRHRHHGKRRSKKGHHLRHHLHHKHHKGRKHHRHHHKHQSGGNDHSVIGKRRHRRHPHKDLCVARGISVVVVCSDVTSRGKLYRCTAVGARPQVLLANAKVCGGTKDDGGGHHTGVGHTTGGGHSTDGGHTTDGGHNTTDPGGQDPCLCGSDKTPICGSQLPTGCNIEPNTIYFCPGKPGSKFEVLQICQPGIQCQASSKSGSDPVYGGSTCSCTGVNQLCSDQFPDSCGLTKNTAYKCSPSGGRPEKVSGNTFPRSYKLDSKQLYNCNIPGSIPIPIAGEKCTGPNGCVVNLGDDSVSGDDGGNGSSLNCTCKSVGGGIVLGKDLLPECLADLTVIYYCPKDDNDGGTGEGGTGGGNDSPKPPHILQQCPPGTSPQSRPRPSEPQCGFSNCNCTSTGDANAALCSEQFPTSCGLVPNSVYTCSPSGVPEWVKPVLHPRPVSLAFSIKQSAPCRKIASVSTTVRSVGAHSRCPVSSPQPKYTCAGRDSHQSSKSVVTLELRVSLRNMPPTALTPACGSSFPPACKFDPSIQYKCAGTGGVPVAGEKCNIGCLVQANTDIGYKAQTVYSRKAAGGLPEKKSACATKEVCLKTPVGPTCTAEDCNCKDKDTHCGSTFLDACNLQKNSLYKCTRGALPSLVKDCGPGTCSANVVKGTTEFRATPDDFCIDQCACKEANVPICGSAFDPICRYEGNSLMVCANVGDVPTVNVNCTLACEQKSGPDDCVIDPCACTDTGDTCDKTFPVTCSYELDSVYTCEGPHKLPTKKGDCSSAQVCSVTAAGPICTPEDCICKDNESHCGSFFIDACKRQKNSLYKCKVASLPTLVQDCSPGTCSANVVAGLAVFRASAPDVCIEQCACKEANVPVCTSTFDAICNYNPKDLMDCGNVGDVPTVKETCTLSCTVQPGPDVCTFDPCACKTTGDVCGTAFPASCGYKNTTIYNCAAINALPVRKQTCLGSAICLLLPAGPKCTLDECICKDDVKRCGSAFFGACGLVSNSLYSCVNDSLPTLMKDCSPGVCSGNVASDVDLASVDGTMDTTVKDESFHATVVDEFCIDECACKEGETLRGLQLCGYGSIPVKKLDCETGKTCLESTAGPICTPSECICKDSEHHCGSQFPSTCGNADNTLYKCEPGYLPTVSQNCGDGKCSVIATGDDMCVDKCACQEASVPVCASSFPAACNYDNKTLMNCGDLGNVPMVSETCATYCEVIPSASDAACKTTDICQTVSGGVDVCVPNDYCSCVSTGTVCTDMFPAACAKAANSVLTCPAGTVAACPNGCAGGECKAAGCRCTDDNIAYGASFALACNLVPNALYTCMSGQAPVCSSSFPSSCNLASNIVYSCSAIGATPVEQSGCPTFCYASVPDATCKKECATTVVAATAQIDKVVQAMIALVPTNNVTAIVYPPLISVLNTVKTNLTTVKDDSIALGLVAGSANSTINSILHVFNASLIDLRTHNLTASVALNSSLSELTALIQMVETCAGRMTSDCVGALALYGDIASAAPLTTVSTQLKTIITAFETTLTTGDTSALQTNSKAFGALIGSTAGNVAKYGNVSDSYLLMYDAFSEALRCKDVNMILFADECSIYRDRLGGVIQDFIQFLRDNVGALPVLGTLILDPLLAAFNALVTDLEAGLATSIGGVIAIFYGILQIVNIESPIDKTSPIWDYLLRLMGLLDIPTERGGGGSPCSGLIKIVHMITDAVIKLISSIPAFGYMIGVTLNPLLEGLLTALTLGTRFAIEASYTPLSGALSVVEDIPYFGNIALPFRYLLEATKKVLECLALPANTAKRFESLEEVEESGVEQPEKMLSEV